jgi:hypothetical protein
MKIAGGLIRDKGIAFVLLLTLQRFRVVVEMKMEKHARWFPSVG